MKKITIIALCQIALLSAQACNNNQHPRPEGMSKALLDSASMAIGFFFADMIKQNQFEEVNYAIMFKTMKKISKGEEVISQMEANEIIQKYFMQKQTLMAEQSQKKGAEFLVKNKTKEGVIELESGLQYKILEEGTGISPEATDVVTVHYTGTLIDGTEFDSSVNNGQPATFPLNGVIPGWTEGLQLLKEGGKAMLYIPWELGYGVQQWGPIPAYSTLIFEVELIQVVKGEPQE